MSENKWYKSIYSCPMSVFISIMCGIESLQALIIKGEPTEEELKVSWNEIVTAYSDRVSSPEQKMYLMLSRSVMVLQATKEQVKKLISAMRLYYVPKMGQVLCKLVGRTYLFNPEDKEGYQKMLTGAETRAKSIDINLEIKQTALQAMEDKFKREKKKGVPQEQYFTDMKVALQQANGNVHFDYDKMTVAEYCKYLELATKNPPKRK
jgi:hypothetical protein